MARLILTTGGFRQWAALSLFVFSVGACTVADPGPRPNGDTSGVADTASDLAGADTTGAEIDVVDAAPADVEAEATPEDVAAETVEDAAVETVEDVAAETVADATAETVEDTTAETVEDATAETVDDAASETVDDAVNPDGTGDEVDASMAD